MKTSTQDPRATWWKRALLWSALWVGLMLGIAALDTDFIRADELTPEQQDRASGFYGQSCGFGLLTIWSWLYFHRPPAPRRR